MASPVTTATAIITPSGIEIPCRPDETLIRAAWRAGYYWPTICGGAGECGACRCEIVDGMANAAPPSSTETLFFRMRPRLGQNDPRIRLACCLKLNGPVTVQKTGVTPR